MIPKMMIKNEWIPFCFIHLPLSFFCHLCAVSVCVYVSFLSFANKNTHSPFRMRECFALSFNETIESIKPVLFMIFNRQHTVRRAEQKEMKKKQQQKRQKKEL